MDLAQTFQQLGIAVGLGLLVGLQRERTAAPLAGFRTFPLVTAFGTLCALLAESFGGWVIVAGLLSVAVLIVVGNYAKWKTGAFHPGLTTEVALLVMFGVGAYLVVGHTALAIAIGGGVAVLLYLKPQLHTLAAKIGDNDFKAIMQFAVITLVILPVLPNRAYGPFDVLNPYRIWLMVVLIVGISLGGYVAYKFLGTRVGVPLAGLLGGLISSTATTVSYARRSKQAPSGGALAAVVVTIASAVVFARVLVLLAMVAPKSFGALAPPLAAMFGASAIIAAGIWFLSRHNPVQMPEHGNPTELKSAIYFALVFAAVLFASAAARETLGAGGLYAVSALAGLTDMDAITLSTAQMMNDGQLAPGTGWRLIMVASLSNLLFKAAIASALGGGNFSRRLWMLFGLLIAAGAALLAVWP